MHRFLSVVCLVGVLASSTGNAADVAFRLTGKWMRMTQEFEAKNNQSGEFTEIKRDARIRYELRAEGLFALYNQDKEFTDNKVIGVDKPGVSIGGLVEKNGKYFWQLRREWKDSQGKEVKVEKSWEVSFTKGTWQDFQAGDEIEVVLTAAAQANWNDYHTELVKDYAEGIRSSQVKQFPSVNVRPVQLEQVGHKNHVRISGDLDRLVLEGSDSFLIAKVQVTY